MTRARRCEQGQGGGDHDQEGLRLRAAGIEIVKFAWPGLKDKWPAAYKFLKAYQMTNEQQGPMAMAVEVEGQKAAEVAKAWVDENEAVWKPWVDAATQ